MILNIDKRNLFIFHSVHKALSLQILIKIGKIQIKQTKYVKFLGRLADKDLCWKFHLSELSKNLQEQVENFLS